MTGHQCDTCGKEATMLVQDVVRREVGGYYEYTPTGKLRAGCDEHPVKSIEITESDKDGVP